MATAIVESANRTGDRSPDAPAVLPLQAGDRLTRDEFERRYEAMPDLKKAELIEGRVYIMPSQVSASDHGGPHLKLDGWIAVYLARTPGVDGGDNATVRLDGDNEPQPDIHLRILENYGGQSSVKRYVEGAPEWIGEVAASSASYDLHDKLHVYRRNGVREYLVWRVLDSAIDWFVLKQGHYEPLPAGSDGILRSEVFPGLWLDPQAMLRYDLARVLDVLQEGLASEEHRRFVEQLEVKARGSR